MHTLLLKHQQAVDAERQVSVSTDMGESVNMWRRRPDAVQLRPTHPGASVSDVKFLADGRLALVRDPQKPPSRRGDPNE